MFRRRSQGPDPDADVPAEQPQDVPPEAGAEPPPEAKPARANGPWDVDELDGSHPSHERPRLDLGSLRIRVAPGARLQMQVDKTSGKATGVLLMGEQHGLQLMAIAASKSLPLWPQTRAAIAADAKRRGGTAQEAPGPWGPVLQLSLPATAADGTSGVTPSLVLGIDGPRWMLRATFLGRAAIDQTLHNQMLAVVQDTVVVRGESPMPPGEILPLTPPPQPDQASGEGEDAASSPQPDDPPA
jgi:hypothetical protein